MKRVLSLLLALSLVAAIFSGCGKKEEYEYTFEKSKLLENTNCFSVVSFNVASPWGSLTNDTLSSKRVGRFAQYIKAVDPTSFGTQEMNVKWIEKLKELLPGYDCYYVERGGDDNEKKSETNAIFWNNVLYRCLEQNTFWLSLTPGKESKYETAGCNRVVSIVVLESIEGKRYIHANTHLDNASDEAREYGAKLIVEKINEYQRKYKYPLVVITGDFNDVAGSKPYSIFEQAGYKDSRFDENGKELAEAHSTYNDWGELADDGKPIDFIMSDYPSKYYTLLDDVSGGYISDHYGVYSIYEFPPQRNY